MYEIYTDGATSNNGYDNAVGGWAYVVLKDGLLIHKESGQEKEPKLATNQRMELTAILRACEYVNELDSFATVKVYSDSAYCINCFKQNWWRAWEKNGWVNSKKQPVANQDLWAKLIYFYALAPRYDFCKVLGHSKVFWNEIVDQMAVAAKLGQIENGFYVDDGRYYYKLEEVPIENLDLKKIKIKTETDYYNRHLETLEKWRTESEWLK